MYAEDVDCITTTESVSKNVVLNTNATRIAIQHVQMRRMSASIALRYEGKYEPWFFFFKFAIFLSDDLWYCSFKMHTQLMLITQENYVLGPIFIFCH